MATKSRSKKAPAPKRAAATKPRRKAAKAEPRAKVAKPRKAAPRAVQKAPKAPRPAKAPRARKPRPPKPAEVYGHDAPYNCDDPFVKEPVRLRVCRPDPKKTGRRKCDVRPFVVEGCATPGPGRRAKQMFVVPHTHQYLAPARDVARAREMPLPDNGDCADARFAHSRGRSIAESAYDNCRISDASEAGLSIDPATVSFPNGYGRARGMAARGPRHNPPLLVPGRTYRWASGHGGSGVVTYLGGDSRVARVSMNGSVFGVPTRELLPMGADIGVGYPMTFPNGADAAGVPTSPTFLPPPKSDPHMGKRVFGENVQGMVRGVARCGEKGPRQYVVGGQIVSRARVASALRKEQRERDIAEGRIAPPAPRARAPRQSRPVAPPPRPRLPEHPAFEPMVPRAPTRIIDVQAEEVVRVPRGGTALALQAPRAPMTAQQLLALAKSYPSLNPTYADGQDAVENMASRILATAPTMTSSQASDAVRRTVGRIAEVIGGRLSKVEESARDVASAKNTRARNLAMKAAEMRSVNLRESLEDFETILRENRPEVWVAISQDLSSLGQLTDKRRKAMRMAGFFGAQAEDVARVPRGGAALALQAPQASGSDVRDAVRDAIEMFMGRTPPGGTVSALASAIETGTYNDVLDPVNRNSRAAFEYLTGVKLPKGIGATRELFHGRPFRLLVASGIPVTPPPPPAPVAAGDTYSTGYIGGGKYSISAPRVWLDRLIAAMPRKFPSPRISKNPNGPNDTLSTGSEAAKKAAEAWLSSMGLGRG